MKHQIRNKNGEVVRQSKNLLGIRKHWRENEVEKIVCDKLPTGGKLLVLFVNGDSFECNFASYVALMDFINSQRSFPKNVVEFNGGEQCGK